MRPDLKQIRERCDAATPGPWRLSHNDEDKNRYGSVVAEYANEQERIIDIPIFGDCGYGGHLIAESIEPRNRRFLAESRQDIPDLLAYIERLERVVGAAKRFVNTGNCTSEVPNGPGCGVDKLVDVLKDLESEG